MMLPMVNNLISKSQHKLDLRVLAKPNAMKMLCVKHLIMMLKAIAMNILLKT